MVWLINCTIPTYRWWKNWRNFSSIVRNSKRSAPWRTKIKICPIFIWHAQGRHNYDHIFSLYLPNAHSIICRLYESFELWLEETRLNKVLHLRLESFPLAYDLNRLALIFANNTVCTLLFAVLFRCFILWTFLFIFYFWCRHTGRSSFNYRQYDRASVMELILGFALVWDTYQSVSIPQRLQWNP